LTGILDLLFERLSLFYDFDLDFFAVFRLDFDVGFGVGSVKGAVTGCVACTGVSAGMYMLVLVAGIGGDNKSQSPVMKISEPGIAKIG